MDALSQGQVDAAQVLFQALDGLEAFSPQLYGTSRLGNALKHCILRNLSSGVWFCLKHGRKILDIDSSSSSGSYEDWLSLGPWFHKALDKIFSEENSKMLRPLMELVRSEESNGRFFLPSSGYGAQEMLNRYLSVFTARRMFFFDTFKDGLVDGASALIDIISGMSVQYHLYDSSKQWRYLLSEDLLQNLREKRLALEGAEIEKTYSRNFAQEYIQRKKREEEEFVNNSSLLLREVFAGKTRRNTREKVIHSSTSLLVPIVQEIKRIKPHGFSELSTVLRQRQLNTELLYWFANTRVFHRSGSDDDSSKSAAATTADDEAPRQTLLVSSEVLCYCRAYSEEITEEERQHRGLMAEYRLWRTLMQSGTDMLSDFLMARIAWARLEAMTEIMTAGLAAVDDSTFCVGEKNPTTKSSAVAAMRADNPSLASIRKSTTWRSSGEAVSLFLYHSCSVTRSRYSHRALAIDRRCGELFDQAVVNRRANGDSSCTSFDLSSTDLLRACQDGQITIARHCLELAREREESELLRLRRLQQSTEEEDEVEVKSLPRRLLLAPSNQFKRNYRNGYLPLHYALVLEDKHRSHELVRMLLFDGNFEEEDEEDRSYDLRRKRRGEVDKENLSLRDGRDFSSIQNDAMILPPPLVHPTAQEMEAIPFAEMNEYHHHYNEICIYPSGVFETPIGTALEERFCLPETIELLVRRGANPLEAIVSLSPKKEERDVEGVEEERLRTKSSGGIIKTATTIVDEEQEETEEGEEQQGNKEETASTPKLWHPLLAKVDHREHVKDVFKAIARAYRSEELMNRNGGFEYEGQVFNTPIPCSPVYQGHDRSVIQHCLFLCGESGGGNDEPAVVVDDRRKYSRWRKSKLKPQRAATIKSPLTRGNEEGDSFMVELTKFLLSDEIGCPCPRLSWMHKNRSQLSQVAVEIIMEQLAKEEEEAGGGGALRMESTMSMGESDTFFVATSLTTSSGASEVPKNLRKSEKAPCHQDAAATMKPVRSKKKKN